MRRIATAAATLTLLSAPLVAATVAGASAAPQGGEIEITSTTTASDGEIEITGDPTNGEIEITGDPTNGEIEITAPPAD